MAEGKRTGILTEKKGDGLKRLPIVSVREGKPKSSKETDRVKVPKTEKEPLQNIKKDDHMSGTKRRVILLFVKIIIFIALFYTVFFVIFGVSRMDDNSMYPAIRDGDLLISYRMEGDYGNGDVVIVEKDGKERVMRIIASQGQEVDISEEGDLKVDGQPPTFQAFYETKRAESYAFRFPYKVSENCYYMLNDYRSNTNDSRAFGEVCRDNIKGRVITKIQVRDL